MKLRDLPSVDELLRDERLGGRAARARRRRRRSSSSGRARRSRRGATRARSSRLCSRSSASAAAVAAPRAERDRRPRAHEPRPRAARGRGARARGRGRRAATRTSSTTSSAGSAARARITSPTLLGRLTGAEAALVVNNNAAAVLLALAALAEGREVVVSRGELIEIGDGFRIPDVLARSGARLVEVGTTNRTRAADYERGDRPGDRAAPARAPVELPRRRLLGAPASRGARRVARRHELPLVDDLGSGVARSVGDEPTPAESLRAGADLVCFSGRQAPRRPAGRHLVGRADLVERLRRHPLQRALRADKLTLAALEGTLALALDPEHAARCRSCACSHEPVERCVRAPSGSRARRRRGRGHGRARRRRRLPLAELPSAACAVEECARGGPPARRTAGRALVRDGRTLLDCRTLTDEEVDEVAAAVLALR